MKALIFNNMVVDVAEQEFPVAPSLTWIDCPSDVKIGFSFDGSTFTDVEAERMANVTYADKRRLAYPSIKDFMEAYTEKEIGGDTTKWDAYVINYNKTRSDNPK
jgi:hypothetical protein